MTSRQKVFSLLFVYYVVASTCHSTVTFALINSLLVIAETMKTSFFFKFMFIYVELLVLLRKQLLHEVLKSRALQDYLTLSGLATP